MSLEYTLEIAGTKKSVTLLATQLSRVLGYQNTAKGVEAFGIQIDIAEPGPLEFKMIEEEFGFGPQISITFRLDKEIDSVIAHTRLLQGCIELLSDSSNDAVLLFNGETIIFLRRNGKFILNLVKGFWTDEVLAVIPIPYEFESIPSI